MSAEQKVVKAKSKIGGGVKLYYVVLALISVALLIFSLSTYYFSEASKTSGMDVESAYAFTTTLASGERNSYSTGATTTGSRAADTIAAKLESVSGLNRVAASRADLKADKTAAQQKITASFALSSGVRQPSFTVQDFSQIDIDYVLDIDTISNMTSAANAGKEDLIYAGRLIKNIVVVIPGTDAPAAVNSSDKDYGAVLFMTHYDSNYNSKDATSASAVSAMIGTIDYIIQSGASYKNDLVFVFTDGRYENSVGAYAFKNQFTGFDRVYSRVKVAFNFDAITAGGALSLVQTSASNSALISEYALTAASVRYDSILTSLYEGRLSSDFDIFYDNESETWELPALNLMTTAGAYDAGSAYDTVQNVDKSAAAQYGAAMCALAEGFGSIPLNGLGGGFNSAGAVSYLGQSLAVSGVGVMVAAVILFVLCLAAIYFGIKNKVFDIKSIFKGIGLVLLVTGGTLAAAFIAYFLIGLLMCSFGIISLNMLTTAHLLTPATLVPALLFLAVINCALYASFKRLLHIKSSDCVRGGSVLTALIGVVLGFAYTPAALPFIIMGLGTNAVMLIISLCAKQFKAKFGFGIGRLFLYTIPMIVALPLVIQPIMIICNVFAAIALPFFSCLITLVLTAIVPYFDRITPVMEDVFEKLPLRTIPVIETVKMEVEDEAKKGKFKTVTEAKVVNHKVNWKYRNWIGITILTLITTFTLIISACLGGMSSAVVGKSMTWGYNYHNSSEITQSIFDDAIVCYVDTSLGTSAYSWLIKDEAVYSKIKGLDGFDYWEWFWDEDMGAYKKTVNTPNPPATSALVNKTESDGGYGVDVSPNASGRSQVVLRLNGLNRGDTISLSKNASSEADFTVTCTSPADDVEVVLPYGYGKSKLNIKSTASYINVYAYEYVTFSAAINNSAGEQLAVIEQYFAEKGIAVNSALMVYSKA